MASGSASIGATLLICSALLTWLGLPGNFSLWPLLALCLVPLFFSLQRASSWRTALVYGFVFGLFFYPLQLYWIVTVLQQYGGLPWVVAVASTLLLVIYMSFYPALFAAGWYLVQKNGHHLLLPAIGAAWWVGLDWLRSWLISGFPWMDIGYGLWSQPKLLQAADLFGHYGFTFLIVLLNATLFVLLQKNGAPVRRAGVVAIPAVVCLAFGWYGAARWQQVEQMIEQAPKTMVGLVQGNVEQTRKWSPEERRRTVGDYVRLSRTLTTEQPVSLIVWPETALPFYPRADELMQPVVDFSRTSSTPLITGAPWFEVEQSRNRRLVNYYNGALLVEPSSEFSFGYYKSHLVPYGEYVPLKKYMPFLAPLVEAAGDFTPGTIEKPVRAGDISGGVLICFESIFSNLSRAWVNVGANLLVNLTNDAWYGKSSAPHQSWAMTVYRSVETRRALVRSANTGISGFIDPLGRVSSRSGLFVEWADKEAVALLSTRTFFVRGGYLFAPICAAAAVMLIILSVIAGKNRPSR
jgi:apolipoprotein N-acyltransferase